MTLISDVVKPEYHPYDVKGQTCHVRGKLGDNREVSFGGISVGGITALSPPDGKTLTVATNTSAQLRDVKGNVTRSVKRALKTLAWALANLYNEKCWE